ncbi:hypothetical protein MNV49_005053 [Pseudohyphozyma bogoriensis]|nr:hypothetical protein MNV49_005053 [Pseudohyphozyma bogoriensis]
MSRSRPPTTLILDNYDSYTRNCLKLFEALSSLEPEQGSAGDVKGKRRMWDHEGWQDRVVVMNVDAISWERFVAEVLPFVDCIILGPGPGSPHKTSDFNWPTRLIQEYGGVVPIFGLCLGHQGIASAFGASVVRAPSPRHGQITRIRHDGNPLFEGIPGVFDAVQFNSLVVSPNGFPDDLEAIGWAENEGQETIMALRHRSRPLWGTQFHPESISSTYGATILSNFLSFASDHISTSPRRRDVSLPLPPSVLALTTSYKRGLPNLISDVPLPYPIPGEVFEGLVKGSSSLGEIWLDSARPAAAPQYSHFIAPSCTWSYSLVSNTMTTRQHSKPASTSTIHSPNTFFTTLGNAQDALKRLTQVIDSSLASVPIGFIGYIGYEMKQVSLPHCLPKESHEGNDSEFAFASQVLTYEHETRAWRATCLVRTEVRDSEAEALELRTASRFGVDESEAKAWLSRVTAFITSQKATTSTSPRVEKLGVMTPDLTQPEYVDAIERARSLIADGDSYELCLTTTFRSTISPALAADPYPLYLALRASNPAPYSAYFHLPQSDISILSSSPERFMQINRERFAEMKPIKGTVRRSDDPVEDERRRVELEKDVKERAENLMIVDLCRNDLLGFCEVETVEVPKLMVVESYQTVHQLVTSVVGQLTPMVNPFEAVSRAFPPGSMTGAPKLRSVKLLEELEGHRPRGVYSGVFGFVAVDGTTDFSVVIRTLVIKGQDLSLGAGGAITYLSEAEKEWEEVLVKKEAVLGRL